MLTVNFSNTFSQSRQIEKDKGDFYFEKSKGNWNEKSMIWKLSADRATIRLGYFRGDCCGSVPTSEQITAKINLDTVFYNLNTTRHPDCRTEIGLCGSAIDFVIDTKKYPNYKNMVFHNIATKGIK